MANLIVAFPDRQTNHNVCAMLESGGFDVTRTCATGNEVMRAFNLMQDGVLICAARFPDRTADTLAGDLEGRAMMLVVARPAQLELCEHPAIFKLQAPVSRMALNASASLMLQLFDKRKPRRGRAEEAVVQAAKELLIAASGVSEAAAHRALQRYSMQNGVKLLDAAQALLDGALPWERIIKDL